MSEKVKVTRDGKLSAAIDTLLVEGGRRVNEIAELVVSQSNGAFTKPQVVNNIRSRMNVLVKRGFTIERDAVERRRIRLVAPVVVTPAVV